MGSNERAAVKLLSFCSLSLLWSLASAKVLHEESACYRDRVRLDCGERSFIAVHEAFFTTRLPEGAACGRDAPIEHEGPPAHRLDRLREEEAAAPAECHEDIRVAINRRCSGAPNCSFSYREQAEKKCADFRGQFVVRYDCVKNSSVVKFCNTRLRRREGYFSSPGFPRFYPKLSRCGWTLFAAQGQIIHLRVLHLHLGPPTEVLPPAAADPGSPFAHSILGQIMVGEVETRCESDVLVVLEKGQPRAELCGEDTEGLREFEVACGQVEVEFRSSEFNPASGFLMYYKVLGCPLPGGDSVRLLEGNGSLAMFQCTGGRVFNDTLDAERTLHCVHHHHWNDSLPPCVVTEDTSTSESVTNSGLLPRPELELLTRDNATHASAERTTTMRKASTQPELIADVIVPAIVVGGLLVGNAFILAFIFYCRRKQKTKTTEEDQALQIEEDQEENEDQPPEQQPAAGPSRSVPMMADINDL